MRRGPRCPRGRMRVLYFLEGGILLSLPSPLPHFDFRFLPLWKSGPAAGVVDVFPRFPMRVALSGQPACWETSTCPLRSLPTPSPPEHAVMAQFFQSFVKAVGPIFRPAFNVLKRGNGYLEWAFPDNGQVSLT